MMKPKSPGKYLLILYFFIQSIFSYCQNFLPNCNCAVNAGKDIEICEPGGTVQLNGTVTGDFVSYHWKEAPELSDTSILNPTATVDQNATFTLITKCRSNTFLPIINANFTNGNVGFSTGYIYDIVPGTFGPDHITVTNNPIAFNSGFSNCQDHTTGSGNMLLIDGSVTAGTDIWCQNVNLTANTSYVFEFWVTTVFPVSPPDMQVTVNGVPIGNVTPLGNNCLWQRNSYCFTSTTGGVATICFNENSGVGFGNDFAIDDISLLELCTYEDKINVKITPAKTTDVSAEICQGQSYTLANQTFLNEGTYVIPLKTWKGCDSIVTLDLKVIEVLSEIEPPSTLGCGNTSLYLTGYNSSFGSGYSYLWKTKDGKIISDPTLWEINISKAGAYELIVSYNDGLISCSKSDMVTVTADTTKPVINAGPDGQLSCTDSLLSLHGTINSPVKYALNWTSTNGTFVSKTDTLSPVIKSPGTYIMHVTDSSNFCMTIDTVIVSVDASLPKSIITGSSLLTCIDSIISLNALLSDQGSDFTFKWTTTGGNIISNIDSLVIQVNSSGQYYLEIDNIKSGCKSTSSININGDFLKAMVDAGLTDTLSCQLTSLFLTGQTNLADSLVTYLWSTYNGKIVSGNTTLTPLINKVGTYVLRVLNKQNGCIQIDSVLIVNDKNLPVSIAGKSDTITCLKSIIDLIGNGSSSGPNITYLWTSINGNFTSPTDQIIAKSDKDGMYVLTVFNQLNGCSSTDTVVIGKNTSFPIANAGATDTLTCVKQNLILNGNGSSAGPKFSYSWTTLNGNIVSGQNTLIPNINLYGNYILLVSNNENGCTNSDTVQIIENKVLPDISVIPTEILTCANPIINLSGVNNSGPGQFKYLWTTINGVIVSGQNNLAPTINAAGTYTLISTNLLNGCTDQDIVMVNSMGEIPQVNAGVDSSLNCSHPNISLSANLVYTGGNLNINWTTINGTIQSGANSLNPLVSKAGIYTITVIDTITGCTNFDQISIGIDTVAPLANLLLPEKLNCIKLITDIEANINNPLWTYTWTTINGNITSGNNNYIAQTDKPGLYSLFIHNLNNGCDRLLSTTVTEDIAKPSISAGPDKLLTCEEISVNLNASVSSPNGNYNIQWLSGGIIVPGASDLNPIINKEGPYVLVISNNLNGCTSQDTVLITQNINLPNDFVTQVSGPGCLKTGIAEVTQISGGVGPYQYAINGGPFQIEPDFLQLLPGDYTISIKDINGCKFNKEVNIPEPQQISLLLPDIVTIEFGDGGQLIPIPSIPIDQIETVSWSPVTGLSCSDCLYPFANPNNHILYHLTITDKSGCTAIAKVIVSVIKTFNLYLPNVFSPNADGINDIWYVFGDPAKVTKIKLLRIFDRWGESIFEATNFPINDPAYGWNGKYKDKFLNPAVFVYYLEAEFIDGSVKLFKGDITISR